MRKVCTFLMVLGVMSVVLAGCGSSGDSAKADDKGTPTKADAGTKGDAAKGDGN